MKTVIIANDEVAYSGILIYPLLKKHAKEISAIFIQDGILNSKMNSSSLFMQVRKKSGWSYTFFLVRKIMNHKIAISIRRFLHLNKDENDCVLDLPSKLGKRFNIPVYKLSGTIHNEPNLKKIRQLSPELIIAIRYAEILKKSLLSIPKKGVINIHPSLLPKYGGLGPIFQAMIHEEKDIGYTIHFMNEEIDAGPIIKQEIVKRKKDDTVCNLNIRIHVAAGYGLLSCINKIKQMQTINETMNKKNGSYFSWPDKNDVRRFLNSGKKLIRFSDFIKLVFFNPESI